MDDYRNGQFGRGTEGLATLFYLLERRNYDVRVLADNVYLINHTTERYSQRIVRTIRKNAEITNTLMNDNISLPPSLRSFLSSRREYPTAPVEVMKGGAISTVVRLRVNTGHRYVVKYFHEVPVYLAEYVARFLNGCPPVDLYAREADGLHALRSAGGPRVPEVIAVTEEFLLLEDLGGGQPSSTYWEEFGRQIATLHNNIGESYGYHSHNYFGITLQHNRPTEDGYEFYIQQRMLRYLNEGHCKDLLTKEDRRRIESVCDKLRDLVPVQLPVLCHGDLWSGNTVVTDAGHPAYLDPAVYYGWAEADLRLTDQYEQFDNVFFESYREIGDLEDGWRDRLEIYFIIDLLNCVAHFGDYGTELPKLRALLKKYSAR